MEAKARNSSPLYLPPLNISKANAVRFASDGLQSDRSSNERNRAMRRALRPPKITPRTDVKVNPRSYQNTDEDFLARRGVDLHVYELADFDFRAWPTGLQVPAKLSENNYQIVHDTGAWETYWRSPRLMKKRLEGPARWPKSRTGLSTSQTQIRTSQSSRTIDTPR
eukprot:GILJ01012667.1.p1 GENE.GILJ01012667.1~~GILJ01012667.1.p1  ORF type:complete len:185 (+),score=9.95 GILJ01012667.1:59-556(+)